jgi:hypothetical protein
MKPRLGWRASFLGTPALWGTWLAVAAIGCGSSGSGSSIATACADVAQARCNETSECSLDDGDTGTGFSLLANYGDKATCVARQTLNCTNALNAPDNGNNPTQVGKCVAALQGILCAAVFDNQPPAACTPTGPRASGSPCTFNGQCMTGYCNGTKTSVCGTCGAAPAAGDDCSDSTCANGARCVAATTECQVALSSGGVCDSGHPCDRGLSCMGQNDKTMTTGICQTASTEVGAACGGTTLPGCDSTQGLYCGGPNGAKTCLRVIYPGYNGTVGTDAGATPNDAAAPDGGVASPTPAGTLCGLFADGARSGCVAGECYTATGVATGSDFGACKPFAADNGPCDTSVGPGCMFPARCVVSVDGGTAGTCVVPVASMCPSS